MNCMEMREPIHEYGRDEHNEFVHWSACAACVNEGNGESVGLLYDEADGDWSAVPERTKAALRRYVRHHGQPGGFLTAVLSNDLVKSCNYADPGNAVALHHIVSYVYNVLPGGCWGSPERVAAWTRQ